MVSPLGQRGPTGRETERAARLKALTPEESLREYEAASGTRVPTLLRSILPPEGLTQDPESHASLQRVARILSL